MRQIDKRWQEELKNINRGLFVEWHEEFARLMIKHRDDRTGLVRNVCFVQDKDGNPCDINMNHILYLKRAVEWDRIGENPDPNKLYEQLVEDIKQAQRKRDLERQGFYLDYNKEHRQQWKKAMNQFLDSMSPWEAKMLKQHYKEQKEKTKTIRVGYTGGNLV